MQAWTVCSMNRDRASRASSPTQKKVHAPKMVHEFPAQVRT
jgi:hypothetical protein